MHIAILGHGSLADSLARAAERAGHVVARAEPNGKADRKVTSASLLVVADAPEIDPSDPTLREALADGAVVVDALSPSVLPRLMQDRTVPEAKRCIVRAFASVPADQLASAIDHGRGDGFPALAVPLAGDNRNAKVVVERFIRDIGLEPFDVGTLGTADVIEPGGPLWGKAFTPTELLEAVGELSGDG